MGERTIRKVVIHRPGGLDRLRVEEHPAPEPGPGEVRVAVCAAGVNFADLAVRMGLYASAKKYVGFPITPGFEFSGRIAECGPGVDAWAVGDEVFGVTRFGGYATEVCVPVGQVFVVPPRWSAAEAAAFPAVHLTAWYAWSELAKPDKNELVLVHSAAGGVGGVLLRLAQHAGVRAVGVVTGAHKLPVAEEAGAWRVIDAAGGNVADRARELAPEGYAAIFDANGARSLRQSWSLLAEPGRLVVYGFATMLRRGKDRPSWPKLALDWVRTPRFSAFDMVEANRSVLGFNLSFLFPRTDLLAAAMTHLQELVLSGTLRPPSVRTFPLEACAEAHRALASGETTGKLALVME